MGEIDILLTSEMVSNWRQRWAIHRAEKKAEAAAEKQAHGATGHLRSSDSSHSLGPSGGREAPIMPQKPPGSAPGSETSPSPRRSVLKREGAAKTLGHEQ